MCHSRLAPSARYGHDRAVVSLPVCGAFVGRAAELAALQDAYRDPAVHTVLVGGEAGIGKSRLVAEFTTRLGARTAVLSGRCPEFGAKGLPFTPFVAVMRALLREQGVERLAALLPVSEPALARWLPELAARAGGAEPETDRIRLFGEILTVLEQFSMTKPLVVVLEDLHWADEAGLELLAFLVANLARGDLFLVGTYRPADSGPLRKLVAGLRRDQGVRLLTPPPLTRHEVGRQLAALRGGEPEPGTIARVFERSKGIPLFVEALGPAPEATPAELSELLLGYLSDLPDQAASVLRLAAAAGSPVRHSLLAAASDLGEDALTAALHKLVGRQLLVPTDTGYEFRHVLIRDAVYGDLLPAERKRLHARLSRALLACRNRDSDHCPSGELAYHAYAAGELPLALEAAWDAAANAESVGAQRVQVRHLDQVLELWDRVPEAARRVDADRIDVVEAVVAACYRGGVVERGITAADEALSALDAATDPERAARLHHYRAGLRNQSSSGGEDDLLAALAYLPPGRPSLLRGEVLAELAATRVFSGAAAAAENDARAAVEVAERLEAGPLAARAYAYLGLATADRREVAMAHFERAHAAAKTAGDPGTLLTVVLWESALLVSAGANEAAIAAIQQGLRAAHETYRFAEAAPILLVKWAQALTALGRWNEALDLIDESLTERLPPLSTAALLLCHAEIMLARGDADAAATSAATAQPLLGDRPCRGQPAARRRDRRGDVGRRRSGRAPSRGVGAGRRGRPNALRADGSRFRHGKAAGDHRGRRRIPGFLPRGAQRPCRRLGRGGLFLANPPSAVRAGAQPARIRGSGTCRGRSRGSARRTAIRSRAGGRIGGGATRRASQAACRPRRDRARRSRGPADHGPAREHRGPHPAGTRRATAAVNRREQPSDRGRAVHQRQHRGRARLAHPHQARRVQPHRGGGDRAETRIAGFRGMTADRGAPGAPVTLEFGLSVARPKRCAMRSAVPARPRRVTSACIGRGIPVLRPATDP